MESWLGGMDGVDLYKGYAQFEGDHTVRVGADVLSGETIVIHTGASPKKPPIPGMDEVEWLDNASLLDLRVLPPHLAVIGGSYIGMEFAQAFRRFGSDVTILENGAQLMFREDADIAEAAQDVLEEEGVEVILNADINNVSRQDNGLIEILIEHNGAPTTIQCTHLLVAAGRAPNSAGLNLAAPGVETDERGYISVNDVLQTNVQHIFALGDVNGSGAFTHTSVNDGEIFWDFYSGDGDRKLSDRIVTYAMYIDPPLGRIGLSEKQAHESGRNVLMAKRPMKKISRAKEKDETAGLVKIMVDAETEQILGATILGVGGDEIVSMFAPFMYAKQSYKLFRRAVLPHPTVAEMMPWIIDDLTPLQ
jgi:pyruvate/2-oxoglutarate dehydrogenase complex dihydrolipoamide dehydrogenase (E3) component